MRTDELKTLIRTEAGIAATYAAVDAEYGPAKIHADALGQRRAELQAQLDEIAAARAELATLVPKPEPVPDESPADEPADPVTDET